MPIVIGFAEILAERGGFEPPVQLLTVQRFSNSLSPAVLT